MNQSAGSVTAALANLLDVALSSISNGQTIVYNSTSGKWENGSVSATDSTKLPLAGGTMTGALKMSGTVNIDAVSMEMYPAGSGLLYRNVPTGGLYGECVNGAEVYQLGASGIAFPYAHSTPGTNVVGVYRDGSGNLCLGVGSGAGLIAKVAGSRAGGFPLTPSDMPYSAVGATFANDGNWYNLYSLAQGTHNGEIKIACALFGGLVTFAIYGTSISLINDGWGGSYADTTAASGKIAFRVSGGYLQINVGTGISSTPRKFLAIFNGTVN